MASQSWFSINKTDLEQIRTAAVEYWARSDHEFKETFIVELKRGALLIGNRAIKSGKFTGKVDVEDWSKTPSKEMQTHLTILVDSDTVAIGVWKLEIEDDKFFLKRSGAHKPDAIATVNVLLDIEKTSKGWQVLSDSFQHEHLQGD